MRTRSIVTDIALSDTAEPRLRQADWSAHSNSTQVQEPRGRALQEGYIRPVSSLWA